ncbi:EexN family lipoprotein [Delftia deserti]|uniref:EexN family lipoprotein n=1 Tax=Delftia deserti TaxID=1651218 RepID=A0ABW5EMI7_9BURK
MSPKIIAFLSLATLLASCGKSSPPTPIETVESLAANPERLKELRQQCKVDRAKLGDALCNNVAEATNKRFFGDGKVPYTPPKEPPKF